MKLSERLLWDEWEVEELLERWELDEDDENHFTMKPKIDPIRDQNGMLKAEVIDFDQKYNEDDEPDFDLYDPVSEYIEKIYGKPNTHVRIDEFYRGPEGKDSASFGFIYIGDKVHRYVVAKGETGRDLSFISYIDVEVKHDHNNAGQFWEGEITTESDGLHVDTSELITFALTLRPLTTDA